MTKENKSLRYVIFSFSNAKVDTTHKVNMIHHDGTVRIKIHREIHSDEFRVADFSATPFVLTVF